MKQRKTLTRTAALILTLALLLPACSGGTTANTMKLVKIAGTVGVSDEEGRDVTPVENLGLYSGYGVDTQSESYAWVNLDDVKLTKLDEGTEIEITKDGKKLDIEVKSGALFFNVTEPLTSNETLDIRTSTMMIGIRGTCGWVTTDAAYLLEGTVEVSAGTETATVNAGEMAYLTPDGELVVEKFYVPAVPAFVQEEVEGNENIPEVPDASQALPAKSLYYLPDGTLTDYSEYTYNERGLLIRTDNYPLQDGVFSLDQYSEFIYDDQGERLETRTYDSSGALTEWRIPIERTEDYIIYASYNENGEELYQFTVNLNQQGQRTSEVHSDISIIYEYDQAGREIRITGYDSDGTVIYYREYSYD